MLDTFSYRNYHKIAILMHLVPHVTRVGRPISCSATPCKDKGATQPEAPSWMSRTTAMALGSLLLLSGPAPALADRLVTGRARVVDGDTMVLNSTLRIRMYGIDAPESKQR